MHAALRYRKVIGPKAYQTEVLRSSAALSRCNGQMHTQLLYRETLGLTACQTDLMKQKTNNAALSSCNGQMHAQLRYRQSRKTALSVPLETKQLELPDEKQACHFGLSWTARHEPSMTQTNANWKKKGSAPPSEEALGRPPYQELHGSRHPMAP